MSEKHQMSTPIIVGWAAVSSGRQADEDKVSLTRQIAMNITEARRWGRMALQLVVPGFTRDITLFEEAATRVTGWHFDSTGLDGLDDKDLESAIDARLAALRGTPYIYPYAELKQLIDTKSFNCFSFYNLGRVGRDAALSLTVMRLCQRAGIFTYSTKAPPASLDTKTRRNYQANLIDAVQAVGYENEVRELQDRHSAGMVRRIEHGRMPGNVNFGYIEKRDARGKVIGYEIDEPAAVTIRSIVGMYLDRGLGCPQIADALNRAGHDTADTRTAILAGKEPSAAPAHWASAQVAYLIKVIMRYAGLNEVNRYSKTGRPHITAPGMWPAIISEELARRVTTERSTRRGQGAAIAKIYRFTRLLYCEVCNAKLSATNGYTKFTVKSTGEEKRSYTLKWHCRQGHVITTDKRVYTVIRHAIETIADQADAYGIVGETIDAETTATTQADIETLEAAIARLKASADRVDLDYYVAGKIDSSRHSAILGAIQRQIESAMHDITLLRDKLRAQEFDAGRGERIVNLRRDGLAYLEDPDIAKANAWLRQRIRVYVATGRKFRVEVI